MVNQEPMEAVDTIQLQIKKISAFRRIVLNYIYLTFLVPFQFKNLLFSMNEMCILEHL